MSAAHGNHRPLSHDEGLATITISRHADMRLFDRLPRELRDRINYAGAVISPASTFVEWCDRGACTTLELIRDVEVRYAPSFTQIVVKRRGTPRHPCPEQLAYRVPPLRSTPRAPR